MDESERAEIVISGDGDRPILEVDGLTVDVPAGRDPMLVGIELVATTATRRGQPVPATVIADEGNWQWRMLVHPDGTTTDDTDDGERRAGGLLRRRPSRLALAAIGVVVLAGGGITALAVSTNSDHVGGISAGSIGGSQEPAETAPSATASPTPSPAPLAPPTTAPVATTPPASPQAVAPAGVPRTTRPVVAPPAPRRTTKPVVAPRPAPAPAAAPAGRLVVISDGAGNCATANGSAVSAGSCTGGAAQKWTATAAGELRQGGRCLVTRSGIAVVDCASVPAPARRWTPTSPSPGLVNPATSLCLGAAGPTVVAAQCGTGRSLRIA